MRAASSEERNNAALATSWARGAASGLIPLTAYSCGGWSSLPEPTLPGATALARMPYRPSSSARVLTSEIAGLGGHLPCRLRRRNAIDRGECDQRSTAALADHVPCHG